MIFHRWLLVFIVLAYIDFMGIINPEEFLRIEGVFKVYDLFILIGLFYIAIKFWTKKDFNSLKRIPSFIIITSLLFMIILVAASMTIRVGENFINAMKIGRYYLSISIFYIALYDIKISKSTTFIRNLVIYIGSILSFIFIIGFIFPEAIVVFFPYLNLTIQNIQSQQFQRYYTPGFLFPIVAGALLIYQMILRNKDDNSEFTTKWVLLILNLSGIILQGFRSYIISFILILIITLLITNLRKQMLVKLTIVISMVLITLYVTKTVDIFNTRLVSSFSDLLYKEGTFGYRITSDILRIKLFMQNPLFGLGFIDANSVVGKSLNLDTIGQLAAYSTDSGYLTLLISFGAIGSIIYILCFFTLIRRNYYIYKRIHINSKVYPLVTIIFIIILLVTLVSHGGIFSPYGLVPLALIMALSEGKYLLSNESYEDPISN